jgi:hypothetical protein
MATADGLQQRFLDFTSSEGARAAGVKAAAGRRIGRARKVASKLDAFASRVRIRDRYRRHQRDCVGVCRCLEDLRSIANFDNFAEIHDRNPMRDGFHNGEIVTDEK